ncbi:MAG: GtrA family protein [Clostridiaceae bacterium]
MPYFERIGWVMTGKIGKIDFTKFKDLKYFIRFAIVGVINTGVDFLVFTVLNEMFVIHYAICQVAGYSSGVVSSFILNRVWTFGDQKAHKKLAVQFSQFVFVNIISLLGSLAAIRLCVNVFGLNVYISKIFATLIAQALNFTGYRFWVFMKK